MGGPAANLTAACLPALAALLRQAVGEIERTLSAPELAVWRAGVDELGRAVEFAQRRLVEAELSEWRSAFVALHAAIQSPPAAVPPAPAPQTEDEIFANVDATLHAAP